MKKPLSLAITVLLPISVLLGFFLLNADRPPGWKAELDTYLAFKKASSGETLSVISETKAREPWNFNEEMDALAYSSSVYFQARSYQEKPEAVYAPQVLDYQENLEVVPSRKPLPYPPEDVWCVRLGPEGGFGQGVVFVALHEDLYKADFAVHETPGETDESSLAQKLTAIGCIFSDSGEVSQ